MLNKLLIISGPTASGKTALVLKYAAKYGGEIVSADSRHVYKGMDIGTGKDIPQESKFTKLSVIPSAVEGSSKSFNKDNFSIGYKKKDGVPIWLVDIVNPDFQFNLADYYRLATLVIKDIHSRNKLPIIVGGTGLYIKSLLVPLPNIFIPPDLELRNSLENKSVVELQELLQKKYPHKFNSLNNSDRSNPRRLVRALEIGDKNSTSIKDFVEYDWRLIYLDSDLKELYKKIDNRVEERVKNGILNEIGNLISGGYSFDLPSFTACGYSIFKPYFTGGKNPDILKQILTKWKFDEHALSRRQKIWFNTMLKVLPADKIIRVPSVEKHNLSQLEQTITKWYTSIN